MRACEMLSARTMSRIARMYAPATTNAAKPTVTAVSVALCGKAAIAALRFLISMSRSVERSKSASMRGKALQISASAYPPKLSATFRNFSRIASFSALPQSLMRRFTSR